MNGKTSIAVAGIVLLAVLVAVLADQQPARPPLTSRPPPTGEFPRQLEPFREAIEATRLDTVRIRATKAEHTGAWRSKFRGAGYLPKGGAYPQDPRGKPMVLLAQINFAEMPPLKGYPAKGLLQFFVAGDEDFKHHIYGSRMYDEKPYDAKKYFAALQDQTYFRTVFIADPSHDPQQQEPAQAVSPEGYLPIMDEAELSFEAAAEPVLIDDYRFEWVLDKTVQKAFDNDTVADDYWAWAAKGATLAKVGGYGWFTQEDPRTIDPDGDWLVLLQIRSSGADDGVDVLWGDAGVGGLFIRRADLEKQDFSRVVYYWDNY